MELKEEEDNHQQDGDNHGDQVAIKDPEDLNRRQDILEKKKVKQNWYVGAFSWSPLAYVYTIAPTHAKTL